MLGLKLRKEFQGKFLKGTAIELANNKNTGATQIAAEEFLAITYPTTDVLASIEAIGPDKGHPVVLLGDRGQGKSHLLGVLYHVLVNRDAAQGWLGEWAQRMGRPDLNKIQFRPGMHVISESLHRQKYYISISYGRNIAYMIFRRTKIRMVVMLPEKKIKPLVKHYSITSLSPGVQKFYGRPCVAINIDDKNHLGEIRTVIEALITDTDKDDAR